MKISDLIKVLQAVGADNGDVEALVEVYLDDVPCLMPVDEVSFEDREVYGPSVTFLM